MVQDGFDSIDRRSREGIGDVAEKGVLRKRIGDRAKISARSGEFGDRNHGGPILSEGVVPFLGAPAGRVPPARRQSIKMSDVRGIFRLGNVVR